MSPLSPRPPALIGINLHCSPLWAKIIYNGENKTNNSADQFLLDLTVLGHFLFAMLFQFKFHWQIFLIFGWPRVCSPAAAAFPTCNCDKLTRNWKAGRYKKYYWKAYNAMINDWPRTIRPPTQHCFQLLSQTSIQARI